MKIESQVLALFLRKSCFSMALQVSTELRICKTAEYTKMKGT